MLSPGGAPTNLQKHLKPVFGTMLISDLCADDIGAYQSARLKEGAAPKTVNLELGTLRAILRKHRLWANIQPDVRMLDSAERVGCALAPEQEAALLKECRLSRSRSLYVAVVIALGTCMRYGEIREMRWKQIDFSKGELRVENSKTNQGEGRVIPLSPRVRLVLEFWAGRFPKRKPAHFVFPFEKYGGSGADNAFGFTSSVVYASDPTQPIGSWKEAWEAAKKRAGRTLNPEAEIPQPLICRFHDLRHTGCTRMLEAGVPFSVVSEIMGWAASTAIRMSKIYGHIGNSARRDAVEKMASVTIFDIEGAQNWAQALPGETPHVQ
jgi:integrase